MHSPPFSMSRKRMYPFEVPSQQHDMRESQLQRDKLSLLMPSYEFIVSIMADFIIPLVPTFMSCTTLILPDFERQIRMFRSRSRSICLIYSLGVLFVEVQSLIACIIAGDLGLFTSNIRTIPSRVETYNRSKSVSISISAGLAFEVLTTPAVLFCYRS